MKLQKQLIKHDPENGFWGDCYRTCIACLLGIDAADVPHFCDDAQGKDIDDTEANCRAWLKSCGYNIIKVCMLECNASYALSWFDDMPYILTGQSPNFNGVAHCVIGRGAFDVVWDVSPLNKGLAGPWVDENGNRVYWIEFIVPIQEAA